MNDFKKNHFGGDKRGGGGYPKRDFNRPSFGGGRGGFGGGFKGGDRGPVEMHEAVCASCGKTCEVPFRPNGRKPVYCKECFAKNGGGEVSERPSFAPRREFSRDAAPSFSKPAYAKPERDGGAGMDDVKKQIQTMNMKLDKLMQILLEKNSGTKQAKQAGDAPETSAEAAPAASEVKEKKAVKKVSAKKKK